MFRDLPLVCTLKYLRTHTYLTHQISAQLQDRSFRSLAFACATHKKCFANVSVEISDFFVRYKYVHNVPEAHTEFPNLESPQYEPRICTLFTAYTHGSSKIFWAVFSIPGHVFRDFPLVCTLKYLRTRLSHTPDICATPGPKLSITGF